MIAFNASDQIRMAAQMIRMMPPDPVEIEVVNLSFCPDCKGGLVQPVSWREMTHGWYIQLKCPDCGNEMSGMWDDITVEAFDRALESATDSVVADIDYLQRSVEEDGL